MEVFIWGKLPIPRGNEIIISSPLVGVWEVGYNIEFCGPRLKVINVAFLFQVKATHGIAILDVGKGDPSVFPFS